MPIAGKLSEIAAVSGAMICRLLIAVPVLWTTTTSTDVILMVLPCANNGNWVLSRSKDNTWSSVALAGRRKRYHLRRKQDWRNTKQMDLYQSKVGKAMSNEN